MNNTAKIITGVVAGAAAGVLTGILLAPDSGKKTRKKIIDSSKELASSAGEVLSENVEKAKAKYNESLDSAAKSTKNGVDKAKAALKA